VYAWATYVQGTTAGIPNSSNALETVRLQRDRPRRTCRRPAVSSTTIVLLRFHFRKENCGALLKPKLFYCFTFFLLRSCEIA
jgi:hypothetical protein